MNKREKYLMRLGLTTGFILGFFAGLSFFFSLLLLYKWWKKKMNERKELYKKIRKLAQYSKEGLDRLSLQDLRKIHEIIKRNQ